MNSSRIVGGGCFVWVLAGVAGLAVSMTARANDDQDSLSGPKVKDNSVQGERRTLTGKGDPKLERAGRLPPRVFERAMGILHADDAPEALRLTDDQEQKVRAIREEFQSQMRDYITEHKDEVMQLREKLPPRERGRVDQFMNAGQGPGGPQGQRPDRGRDGAKGRGKGGGRGGPDAPPPPPPKDGDEMMRDGAPMVDEQEAQAAMARLKELLDGAPKPTDAHARVMAILTDAQRDAVNKEVERLQKESADRNAKNGPGAKGGDGDDRREEAMKLLTPEERASLKDMTPEQRRELIRKKLEERKKSGK